MSTLTSQPPALRHKVSTQFSIHEDAEENNSSPAGSGPKHGMTLGDETMPLASSKLANLQSTSSRNVSDAKLKTEHNATKQGNQSSMDSLIIKLSEQQALLDKQKKTLATNEHNSRGDRSESATGSGLLTPATDAFNSTPATEINNDEKSSQATVSQPSALAMELLKKELEDAKTRIACQEQELSQNRASKIVEPPKTGLPTVTPTYTVEAVSRQYALHDDTKSDVSEVSHTGAFPRGQNPWAASSTSAGFGGNMGPPTSIWGQGNRGFVNRPMMPNLAPLMVPQNLPQAGQIRTYSGPTSPSSSNGRFQNDFGHLQTGNRRNSRIGQGGQYQNRSNAWDGFSSSSEPSTVLSLNPGFQPMGMFQASPLTYQQRPIGTPLSPTAAEFTGAPGNQPGPWNSTPSSPGQTYVSPMEPLNYRRLLDRSVTCNWKYIVDKIVCNNDQQASIFLQQKLKVGTVEQKFEIVEAIVAQAYPLMVNRFGNFLVQRCFEHGTPEQVVAIANAIRGNTLSLSMDAFGCHVVQKAFDAVPEEYKAIMVHELLRRIPETVIHRYACHVWQKLFELRWSDSPPQIMKYVNEALRGMWHEVALGETGSLVVQNIFENCLEEDKRPCINEVLTSIDIVAHGQFGNWCIQHICEHGAPADRSHAVDHVLRYATEYSMDQFASKVVEKCLKIGGAEFLERYLDRVCEGRSDRPRIPLIDISSDQYGNYLIQYILTHANAQHREIVASHIRKHMVSLRGSKFGSRVGMLCSNPAYATRPGPGAGPPTNRFNSNGSSSRFSGQFR